MKLKAMAFLSLLFVISVPVFATTWNEPWHDEVVKNADSFVFAQINSFDEKTGVNITIVKTISGIEITGPIKITGFYQLEFSSFSGDDGGFFHFENAPEGYFFIKKDKNGNFCIATPTTGFAIVKDGMVYATYRHSYHQALVPKDIYEKTMEAIFNNYHNRPYDNAFINEFVKNYINQKPANLDSSGANLFFMQHVALESIFHLRLSGYYSEILPFLKSNTHFHVQVSAARALAAYNTDDSKNELMKIINANDRNNFVQVMSIWTLAEYKPTELRQRLIEMEKNASTENNGFGGNIMDPRVGTYIPSVKIAIQNLIKSL